MIKIDREVPGGGCGLGYGSRLSGCRHAARTMTIGRVTRDQANPAAAARPGILAATVAELPGLDGATVAIAGLHHGERGTIMHLLATGVTPEDDWPYARGARPCQCCGYATTTAAGTPPALTA